MKRYRFTFERGEREGCGEDAVLALGQVLRDMEMAPGQVKSALGWLVGVEELKEA